MKKIFSALCLLTIVTLFSTCDYGFSEDYYNSIEIINPEYNLSVSNFTNDEIMRDSKYINFNYSSITNNPLYTISFLIDETLVLKSGQNENRVYVNISNLADGNHTIKILIVLKSNTGSMSDIFGLETFEFSESFNFTVDKSLAIVEVAKVEHKDGSIYISWNEPEDIGIYSEINLLIKESYRTTRVPLLESDSLIKKGVFRDSLSLKFNMQYSIEAFNNFNQIVSPVNNFYVTDSIISIDHEIIDDDSFKIKWNKHPLYNNFDHYELTAGSGNSIKVNVDNKGGEYIVNSPFIFGSYKYYSIAKARETYIPDNESFYGTIPFGTPYENNNYESLVYDSRSGFIFGATIDETIYPRKIEIYKLNADNLSVIDKIEFENIDYNFRPELILDNDSNLILDTRAKSIIFDTSSLSVKQEFLRDNYNTNLENYITKTRYRNGLIILDNDYDFRDIYIYNATTKQLITTLKKEFSAVISEDFEFFTVERSVYRIENGNITLLYTLPINSPRFYDIQYIPSKNSILLLVGGHSGNGKECIFFNLDTNSPSVVSNTEWTSFFNYDVATNKVLFINGKSRGLSEAKVLDLDSDIMTSIQVAGNGYGRRYLFLNNYLILLKHDYFLKNRL